MVKTDIEYATLYAALLLRLRNPDCAEFTLTWPLKDGARTVSLGSERVAQDDAQPAVARTPAAPSGMGAAAPPSVPFSPRTRQGGGFGSDAVPVPEPKPIEASGMMPPPPPVGRASGNGPNGSSPRGARGRGGHSSRRGEGTRSGAQAGVDSANLRVRTPEDDDDPMQAREAEGRPGGTSSQIAELAAQNGLDTERVDNAADVARYTGVGAGR